MVMFFVGNQHGGERIYSRIRSGETKLEIEGYDPHAVRNGLTNNDESIPGPELEDAGINPDRSGVFRVEGIPMGKLIWENPYSNEYTPKLANFGEVEDQLISLVRGQGIKYVPEEVLKAAGQLQYNPDGQDQVNNFREALNVLGRPKITLDFSTTWSEAKSSTSSSSSSTDKVQNLSGNQQMGLAVLLGLFGATAVAHWVFN